ncbi:MAG: DNA recombination protein RmuC [Proteobacteria bacterium]|nr:DNA recombination protein RmuC [Pseudomonadota bacterium]MBU1736776.1 DNA recombination protein RmuC [Pseudomonadota bacterium]
MREKIHDLESARATDQQDMEKLKTFKDELDKQLAVSLQKNERIPDLEREISRKEDLLDGLRRENSLQMATIAELNTRVEDEKQLGAEKLSTINNAREELRNQFKTLAQEIFDEKGKKLGEQSRERLDEILKPFKEEIKDFRKKVDDVYVNEAKERASLKKELQDLKELNQRINQEAINLTHALKGDKKAQGNWGELVLERVLEQSGLRKGVEYETQESFRDSDEKLFKPDVIIHLPEEKDVVVDSKVSLLAYERYCSAEKDADRQRALTEHVNNVREHIKGLSSKNYSDLKGIRSLDFVLMFMPIEPAFLVAFQADEKLFSDAFENRIVVVTPTTLLATLRTIENIWRYERQNQNARIISDRASAVYNKLRGFVEDMEKLGKQISTTHSTYDDAMAKLTTGKGNLIRQAERFVELGVKVNKTIPKSITDFAETEGDEDED